MVLVQMLVSHKLMQELKIGDVILVADSQGHVRPETVFLFTMR